MTMAKNLVSSMSFNLIGVVGAFLLAAPTASAAPDAELIPGLNPGKPNRFVFAPTDTRFVRLAIGRSDNGLACIDEMEVYGASATANLALASTGAKASASSSLTGYAIHRIENLNDGLYGNEHSWICGGASGWVQVELPQAATVSSVVISRDREGKLSDRLLEAFDIQTSPDGRQWTTVKRIKGVAGSGAVRQLALTFDPQAIRAAIREMTAKHPDFVMPEGFDRQMTGYERQLPGVLDGLGEQPESPAFLAAQKTGVQMQDFQRRILLANPDLDFDRILAVKRRPAPPSLVKAGYHDELGLPVNFCGNSCINPVGWDNEIGTLSLRDGQWKTFYRPAKPAIVGEVNLHFDAKKMLFSAAGDNGRWQIFEINTGGSGLRQVTRDESPDVDSYGAMYLPDGRIIFNSSSTFEGVPCFSGTDYVANLHLMNADGTGVRRITFDQETNLHPTMLPDGRILYMRWEYADTAHYFSRILMTMNPDGTSQKEYYGSNSYWPNTLFYAKPIPGSSSQFIAVVSGHHGTCRAGELFLFDPAKGRQEATGVVQRVAPAMATPSTMGQIKDGLVDASWPKFLQPYPISDKLYLVSAKLSSRDNWKIYLADTFGNMTLLAADPDYAMFEPVPFKPQPTPPVIPDKINLKQQDAVVFIQDIYEGTGLRGLPRGVVKSLRVFQYEYAYRDLGGHYMVGMEGPWDVRRLLGTVPVYADGSANFRIPANTPVALQPLDAEGKALQQMRSWLVGMSGENVSCIGCHERQDQTLLPKKTIAATHAPLDITPWYGPKRGFSFLREVQPVLNRHCASCHNGSNAKIPDFKNTSLVSATTTGLQSDFPASYLAIHPYVRRNGPEGDYHLLTPLEFHTDTSELVQMLGKGHHGVRLEPEAWDRLITWIDLNVPCHGTWNEVNKIPGNFARRRQEMRQKYAGINDDPEAIVYGDKYDETPVIARETPEPKTIAAKVQGWPFSADEAKRRQSALGDTTMTVDLGTSQTLTFVRIPAGEFAMGSATGPRDERPMSAVKIAKSFWVCTTEIALAQYQAFNPNHRNGFYDQHYKDQVRPGYDMDQPDLPVIRVSWNQSMEFCRWLSAKTGKKVSLPTEAQWEFACRAGSDQAMSFGDATADFAKCANLADVQLGKMAVSGVDPQPIHNPNKYWDYLLKIAAVDDGSMLLAPVTRYETNAWGAKNMHGNVAEWCLDSFRGYPYQPNVADSAAPDSGVKKTVRGGSWNDRPYRATSSFRLAFPAWQQVYNVGFRPVIIEE